MTPEHAIAILRDAADRAAVMTPIGPENLREMAGIITQQRNEIEYLLARLVLARLAAADREQREMAQGQPPTEAPSRAQPSESRAVARIHAVPLDRAECALVVRHAGNEVALIHATTADALTAMRALDQGARSLQVISEERVARECAGITRVDMFSGGKLLRSWTELSRDAAPQVGL